MKITETYSHLNGIEYLLVHKPDLWKEIQKVISSVEAEKCRTKISREKTMKGRLLFSPVDLNVACEGEFYNVVRQGRGVPAVPLVLVGIEA